MKKILVIGDSSRDVFVYCDALRLCPDVPVPVLNIKDQTENPGMAKNVHRNIKSLHDECSILTNTNWYDITKTRYAFFTSGFFRMLSGLSVAIHLPFKSTVILSAKVKTTSISCSISRIVFLFFSSFNISSILPPSSVPIPAMGSSSNNRCG